MHYGTFQIADDGELEAVLGLAGEVLRTKAEGIVVLREWEGREIP